MKKFVILTYGRTGSTYLSLWLNQHTSVRCHGELFNRSNFDPDSFNYFCQNDSVRRALAFVFKREKLSKGTHNPILNYLIDNYFQALYYQPSFPAPWTTMGDKGKLLLHQNASATTVGFKLPYDQFYSYGYLRSWLAKENVPIIHLVRQNLLQVALSFASVRHHGFYHTEDAGITNQRTRFRINAQEVIHTIRQMEAAQEKMDSIISPYPHLKVSYEEFFGEQPGLTAESIRSFLQISAEQVQQEPRLKKINAQTLHDYVENDHELTAALVGAGYDRYIF